MREPTRARYHHGALPAVLVEVSIELIARDGLEAFSLAKAARAAGVSAAAPYAHFSAKAELLRAVADYGYVGLAEALRAVTAEDEDPVDNLLRVGSAYIEWVNANPALSTVMFTTAPQRPPSRTGPDALGVVETCLQRLDEVGQLAVSLDTALHATWSLVHGMAVLSAGGMSRVVESADPEGRTAVMRAVLLGGLLRARPSN